MKNRLLLMGICMLFLIVLSSFGYAVVASAKIGSICNKESDCDGDGMSTYDHLVQCINGYCLEDRDADLFCDLGTGSYNKEKYCFGKYVDCDKTSNICGSVKSPLCKNSDGEAKATSIFNNDKLLDCQDPCTDADGDGYCDLKKSARYYSDDLIKQVKNNQVTTAQNKEIMTALEFQKKKILDSAYEKQFKSVLAKAHFHNIFILKSKITKRKIVKPQDFYDCNDNNPKINPSVKEGTPMGKGGKDLCDYMDNDCDGVVDECDYPPPDKSMKVFVPGSTPVHDKILKCVYTGDKTGCRYHDVDGDGYYNKDFGCLQCTDCDDSNPKINPATVDDGSGLNGDRLGKDDNCNVLKDEMADKDKDGYADEFEYEKCKWQGKVNGALVDEFGCWYSPVNKNLQGWKIEQ